MKKLTMLLLVIALVFSAALAEPLSKSALFGSWSDSNYTNETIGLGFTVGDWHLYSQEEIMRLATMFASHRKDAEDHPAAD